MKKTINNTTRILCKKEGKYHTVTFHADGTITSSGCGDVTSDAKRITAAISLGKAIMEDSCAGLTALAAHGISSLFRQPDLGEYIQWGAWRGLYQRFEENKLVVAAVKRERRAARKRAKEQRAQVTA